MIKISNRIRFDIIIAVSIFFFVTHPVVLAQKEYPLEIKYYEFIHYDKNKLYFPGDSGKFERFFYKIDSIILWGKGKLRIVHIGGSHIQADVYKHPDIYR